MPYFLISHGMGGGFGGSHPDFIGEYFDEKDAIDEAYELAVEDYGMQAGSQGVPDFIDFCQQNKIDPSEDQVEAEMDFLEEIENWIEYGAIEVEEVEDGVWTSVETGEVFILEEDNIVLAI